jgi:predicted nucleic acid-binding protein
VRTLVLDADIVLRAVLGVRVPALIHRYAKEVEFRAPDSPFRQARARLPAILERNGIPEAAPFAALEHLATLIGNVEATQYLRFEAIARERMDRRDKDDWPILATALALGCPIWTEDTDFFGCGVATWSTDLVELFLSHS